MITKDGYAIIGYTGLLMVILLTTGLVLDSVTVQVFGWITAFIFVFHFFFFRDPERTAPENKNAIISPADGTVIKITEVDDPLYHKEKVRLISVFMSVFNVHVNRMPVSGTVEFVDYKKGKFAVASLDTAIDNNEQSIIGIKTEKGKILFKQIAGLIARRIVNYSKEGQTVKAGERFGMIKYSSRLDIYLPLSVELNVKLKDKVKAGISIIGEFK